MTTVSEIIEQAKYLLQESEIEKPSLTAKLLVCHALGLDRLDLLANPLRTVTEEEKQKILELASERSKGKPLSRIKGHREFWGLEFKINEATLDPRPDTETLIETVLTEIENKNDEKKILDLGTGSGCILLTLLHELPNSKGLGIDKSEKAVSQAQENAKLLGLENRAEFITGNWFDNIDETFDIIVSNPPYIKSEEIKILQKEVKEYDPILALDGGEDGLCMYREIIPNIKPHLSLNGIAVLEIGNGQAEEIKELLKENGIENARIIKDLSGLDRCVLMRN
ncbi:MAG: peptide chain release factor N(5)-glutamine methyltransferase [Alphaproteobacteria bacterium]|nr:peptide chain release factor N(5)-glutamine methyltransferase [Alphaproteobacteria bacterium]